MMWISAPGDVEYHETYDPDDYQEQGDSQEWSYFHGYLG